MGIVSVCVRVSQYSRERRGLHTTLCGDALEKVLRYGLIFALEWFDEDDALVGLLLLLVKAQDAERHGDCLIASRLTTPSRTPMKRKCNALCVAEMLQVRKGDTDRFAR